jgi:hypothetical protein
VDYVRVTAKETQRSTICPLTGTTTLGNSLSLVSMMMDPLIGPSWIFSEIKVIFT